MSTEEVHAEPLIALISATPTAIPAATAAILGQLPGARVWNIVDDRLLTDALTAGSVTPRLQRRMERLIDHALTEGPDAVLLTCTQYGGVARRTRAAVPVLAPDDAAFAELIDDGGDILVLASLESSRSDTEQRLGGAARAAGSGVRIESRVVAGAADAAAAGDHASLLDALVAGVGDAAGAVFLAQYSLAVVACELQNAIGRPVITGPAAAAAVIARAIGGTS